MKKVLVFEDKNRVLEKANTNFQKRMERLEARMGNMEKITKKMVDHNSNILKTMVDNVSSLLKKVYQDKGHDSPSMIENQGPSKSTRDHSKKARDVKKMEDMKAIVENMHILADQAADLLKTK